MEELKPCFVCGEKTKSQAFSWSAVPQVSCNNRHCIIYGLWFTVKVWNLPRPVEDALQAENARLREANETLESRVDFLEDKIQEIVDWADAYPLAVFPEPDFKKARVALESTGISLDQVSASNMRHVVTGVGNIAREALKGGE